MNPYWNNPYYHRSPKSKIDRFDSEEMKFGDYGPGFYFSEEDTVKHYGDNLYTVELDIENPLDVENASDKEIEQLIRHLRLNDDAIIDIDVSPVTQIFGIVQTLWDAGMGYRPQAVIRVLQKLGYDGIVVPSKGFWVAFDPNQIDIRSHETRWD